MHSETKPIASTDPQESLGGLISDLMKHSSALIKGEIALVRSELDRKIDIFRTAAVLTAIGSALFLLAFMAFLLAGIMALAAYMGLVASALVCGGLIGIIAAVFLSRGVGHFKRLTN
jgi:hypothetical protein